MKNCGYPIINLLTVPANFVLPENISSANDCSIFITSFLKCITNDKFAIQC